MLSKTPERTIIVHYHLFKNAGTSVDTILQRNFPGRWVTREFPYIGGKNTTQLEDFIRETPDAIAYSSHTMMGPLPQVQGVRIISFMLLRDPIERIRSAYRFERAQDADSWETQLAKQNSFQTYVKQRLLLPNDRQCRNFHTHRLASMCLENGSELERAKIAAGNLSVIGLVNCFSSAIERLAILCNSYGVAFQTYSAWENRSNTNDADGEFLTWPDIILQNQDDFKLIEYVKDNLM